MPQRTLCSILQIYKIFTRWYTDFKKFIEKFSLHEIGKIMKIREKDAEKFVVNNLVLYICVIFSYNIRKIFEDLPEDLFESLK